MQCNRDIGLVVCNALLGLHVFTGCDTTSSFMRKGKVKPFKLMLTDSSFIQAFSQFGEEQVVSEEKVNFLEHFTCVMYGSKSTSTENSCRLEKFLQRFSTKKTEGPLNVNVGTDIS